MSKGLKALVLFLVFTAGLIMGTVGATAVNEEITAVLNREVRIKLNGSDFVPLDNSGKQMFPINYQGSNYLPVRAIANALSVAVEYDPNEKIIYLGEKGRIPVTGEAFENNYQSQLSTDKDQLFINGKQYQWGIVYTGTAGYYEYSGFVYPRGNYQKFGGVVCMEDIDNSTDEVIIKIRKDDYQGAVLKEITVRKGESIPFEIDIPQIKTLYIQNLVSDRVPKSTNPDKMMIAEPYFK